MKNEDKTFIYTKVTKCKHKLIKRKLQIQFDENNNTRKIEWNNESGNSLLIFFQTIRIISRYKLSYVSIRHSEGPLLHTTRMFWSSPLEVKELDSVGKDEEEEEDPTDMSKHHGDKEVMLVAQVVLEELIHRHFLASGKL